MKKSIALKYLQNSRSETKIKFRSKMGNHLSYFMEDVLLYDTPKMSKEVEKKWYSFDRYNNLFMHIKNRTEIFQDQEP